VGDKTLNELIDAFDPVCGTDTLRYAFAHRFAHLRSLRADIAESLHGWRWDDAD
jgi:hypothetical protein